MLAGVCGTDPFMMPKLFLRELKELGFAGIQNFPTVGLIEGRIRATLEETGMSYQLEVDCVRLAREMDLLTTPYVFNTDEATLMTEAGADIVVAHIVITSYSIHYTKLYEHPGRHLPVRGTGRRSAESRHRRHHVPRRLRQPPLRRQR